MGTTLQQIVDSANLLKDIRMLPIVMDIGRQEIFETITLERIKELCGDKINNLSIPELQNLTHTKNVATFFKLFGIKYQSTDVYDFPDNILLDLNFDSVSKKYKSKYSLVRNLGTTEHIFNQYNAFKAIHDFTAPGGYMHHNLPSSHFWGHGFFKYDPKVFINIAISNNYKIIHCQFYKAAGDSDPNIKEILLKNGFDTVEHLHIAAEFIFQKINDYKFIIPLDLDIQGMTKILATKYK